MPRQPAAKAEMIAPDEQHQRDEGPQNREVDHLVAVHRKAAIVDGEGIEEPFPAAGDGEEMHQKQAAIAEIPEYPERHQQTERDLRAAHDMDLRQAHIDPVEMPRKGLVLPRRDDLVRGPEEDEPRKAQPQDQKRETVKPVLRGEAGTHVHDVPHCCRHATALAAPLPDCKSQPGEVSDTDGGDAADQGRGGRREITGPCWVGSEVNSGKCRIRI